MKKVIYFLVSLGILFTSCSKEDESVTNPSNTTAPAFYCKIDNNDFTDNNLSVSVNSSDVLTLDAGDNNAQIIINIIGFSTRSEGDVIPFSTPNMGTVNSGLQTFSNSLTCSQPGEFTITSLQNQQISGTFDFKATELVSFTSLNVTEGVFNNLTY